MKRLWLVIAVLQLAACASEADYRESVEQWIGAREADLVASSWGPPDRVYEVIGSGRILTYSKTSKTQATPSILPNIMIGSSGSGISLSTSTGVGDTGAGRFCETSFTVEGEIITDVTFHGPGCVS